MPVTVLAGTERAILFNEYGTNRDKNLIEQLALLNTDQLDLVLVEGYRDEPFDKIELHRNQLNKPYLFSEDKSIIAFACDEPKADCHLPQLDLNKTEQFCDFILHSPKAR